MILKCVIRIPMVHQRIVRISGDNDNVEEIKGHNNNNKIPPSYEKLGRRVLKRISHHLLFSFQIVCITYTLSFWTKTHLQSLVLMYVNCSCMTFLS